MTAAIYAINPVPSACTQIKELMESGIYHTQKFASDLFNLFVEIARYSGHSFDQGKKISAIFSNGAMGVLIPYAVSSTIEAGQTAFSLAKKGCSVAWREGWEFAQKTAVSVQLISYTAQLFTQRAAYGLSGDVFSAVEDGIDVILATDHLHDLNSKQIAVLSKEARVYLEESKKLHYLKLVKAVVATALGVFGLLGIFFGGPILPSIFLLSMAVTSSALALINRLYKTNMTYTIV